MDSQTAFLGLEGPLAIAHRGGALQRPENTLAAFENAVSMGYRCVETDVRSTRDGVCVVFHDPDLERLTGQTGVIADLRWSDLASCRVGGTEPIPRLEDILAAWPDLRLVIDPKSDDAVAPLIDVLRRTASRHRVCVGSFSGKRMAAVRRELPGCTSCTPREVVRLRLASWGLPSQRLQANAAQVPIGVGPIPVVDRAFIRAAHRRGIPVQVWTVDERAEMERLLDLGVDGIMSDDLATLKQVFEERELWTGLDAVDGALHAGSGGDSP